MRISLRVGYTWAPAPPKCFVVGTSITSHLRVVLLIICLYLIFKEVKKVNAKEKRLMKKPKLNPNCKYCGITASKKLLVANRSNSVVTSLCLDFSRCSSVSLRMPFPGLCVREWMCWNDFPMSQCASQESRGADSMAAWVLAWGRNSSWHLSGKIFKSWFLVSPGNAVCA